MRLLTITVFHATYVMAGLLPRFPTILIRSPGGSRTILEIRQALAPPPYLPGPVGNCTWVTEKPMQSCFPWPHNSRSGTSSPTAGGSPGPSHPATSSASAGLAPTPAPTSVPQHPTPAPHNSPSAFSGPAPFPAHPGNTTSCSHKHSHRTGPPPTSAPTPAPQHPTLALHDSDISSSHYSMPPAVPKHNTTHHSIAGSIPVGGCTWIADRPMQTCFSWPGQAKGSVHRKVPGPLVSFEILPKETASVLVPRTFVTRFKRGERQ